MHADVVVMPGCTLPLLVSNSRAHWVVEQALAAPAPYKCLIAVVRLFTRPHSLTLSNAHWSCSLPDFQIFAAKLVQLQSCHCWLTAGCFIVWL